MTRFDELNNLITALRQTSKEELDRKKAEDMIFDLMVIYYAFGCEDAKEEIGKISDKPIELNPIPPMEEIYRQYDGKDFTDRVAEEEIEGIIRVADTEVRRMYNLGSYGTALKSELNLNKTWVTANDLKVRDTHWYLEGVTLPINEKFVTYDGDEAMYPHGFNTAGNNANCRCILTYSAGKP